jgi:hypothetical protein
MIRATLLKRMAPTSARAADAMSDTAARRWAGCAAIVVLGVTAVILALLMHRAGLTLDPLARSDVPYYLAGLLALVCRFGVERFSWRHARALGDCAEYFGLFTVMALMGAVSAYPVAALTHGYHDAALQRADDALHFGWMVWYRMVAASPLLQQLGIAAYRSIYLTPAILLGWFAATGQRGAAYRFLGTFWVAAVITLSLFSLMPAVGPFSYLWHAAIVYMPESELWQPDLIPMLRAHTVHVVDLGMLRGLVSAPSFHAAAATLYIVTALRIPRLRWPLLCVNAAMLLATPVEGTHYLIDMILGAGVALAAIAVVDLAMAAFGRKREHCGCPPVFP